MLLTPGLRWLVDGVELDSRLLALLDAIDERGSLQRASGAIGLSYRHAWELLGRLESALGQQLVQLERGRGARLTPVGAQLTKETQALADRLRPQLKREEKNLGLAAPEPRPSQARVTICASHDVALGKLPELLQRHGSQAVELHFQGSVDALISLSRNRCEIAGFHVPELPARQGPLDAYRPWLRSRALRLVHFADRRQGLIVARGNPLGISALSDLARTKARFVNRQPGSGTRLCFDALLAAHRVRPAQINGYRAEEFTHGAVAAMIASGAADAGFGIEAAAAQQGLGFVPLATERYFLALRANALGRPGGPRAVLDALASRWFRTAVKGMPGYVFPKTAEPLTVAAALQERPDRPDAADVKSKRPSRNTRQPS